MNEHEEKIEWKLISTKQCRSEKKTSGSGKRRNDYKI
jgi:hypothetical protein